MSRRHHSPTFSSLRFHRISHVGPYATVSACRDQLLRDVLEEELRCFYSNKLLSVFSCPLLDQLLCPDTPSLPQCTWWEYSAEIGEVFLRGVRGKGVKKGSLGEGSAQPPPCLSCCPSLQLLLLQASSAFQDLKALGDPETVKTNSFAL